MAAERDDLDDLGGICTFSPARMHYYAADAIAWLPDHADEAGRFAERACAAYADTESTEWAFGDQAGSQAALCIARVTKGEVEGGADALAPVLRLPAEQRINGIVSSILRVRQALSQSATSMADELIQEIELFTRTPAAALPR